jgi:PKD repeat protein/subtilisin family serine protease
MNWRKSFSLLGLLVLFLATVPFSAIAAPTSQDALNKIEPLVLQELDAKGQTDYFVWLVEQADVSYADQLSTKVQKATYVYESLRATADRTQVDLRAYLDRQGIKYTAYYIDNTILVQGGSYNLLMTLAARPDVDHVTANHKFQLQEPVEKNPATNAPNAVEPNVTFIKAPQVWALGITGQGMVVADDDTGLDETHPAIAQHYRGCLNPPTCTSWDHNYNWWDATGTYPTDPYDGHGHGTHCTGIMIGDDGTGNQIGVAPGAKTIHCKNMDNGGGGQDAWFLTCFQWNLAPWDLNQANPRPDLAPDAVNNSWGYGGGGQNQFRTVINNLQAAGTAIEVSAGNEGSSCATLRSPGDYNEVLTTGSVQHTAPYPGTITGFSSRGPSDLDSSPPYYFPDVMAPGESIRSSLPGNTYAYWSGTSMAGPHDTALIALMWSACPSFRGRVTDTYDIIKATAARLTGQGGSNCGGDYTNGPNNDWGYGTIDTLAAVQAVIAQCGPTGSLDGHVTEVGTGNPIQGAGVTAETAGGYAWTYTTDANGYYTFSIVPEDTYTVTAVHPLYTTASVNGVVVVSGTVTHADLQMLPKGHLFGYVTDYDNGFPLEGATVTAADGTSAATDATGYYEMYLDEGTWVVTATMQDYAPASASVVMVSGQDTQQDFALQAAIAFIPSPLHVTVDWQTLYNTTTTVLNRLPTPYPFEFTEIPGGFIPIFANRQEFALNPSVVPDIPLTTGLAPAGSVPAAGLSGGTPEGPWQARTASPVATMDNVYLDYGNKGYLLGGYGWSGGVGIYDADTDSWTRGATEPAPAIQYPIDGCLGLNASGEPVGILFNDASSGATTLHRYNMATDTWDSPAVPAGFPANGLWGQDTISLLRYTGQNVCYITGGATTPGGGNTSALYEYHPDTNTVVNLGDYNYLATGFAFHAGWYVPWIGGAGGICVGGGVNSGSTVSSDTQCYDIAAATFNAANADLGAMPSGLWGMADDVLFEGGDYQLWVSNGADAGFALWPNSAYFSHNDGTWHIGPTPPTTVYRVEGVNISAADGCSFYVVGGSTGGFTPSSGHNRNFSASCPPTAGADCLWLGEVPTSTVVPAQGSFNPQIYFTATTAVGVNQPGDYYCGLNLQGNPALQVLVTMTVLPGANQGQLHGYVLDNCLGTPVEADIWIENGVPITMTASDKDTGYYSAWLEAGTYNVTFSAAGYLDYVTSVTIVAGQDTWLDVNIVPDRPCIDVDPDAIEVWVLYDTAVYTFVGGLDVTNGGGQDLTYVIHEFSGTTGLVQTIEVSLPAGPQTVPAGTAAAGGAYTPLPAMTYTHPHYPRPQAAPDVLLVCADGGTCEPLRAQLIAFGNLGAVDEFYGDSGTPTLAQLQAYDAVVTWTDYQYADPTGMGNVLADYVDVGGRVIPMMFSMGTHGWQMGGRFMSEGYTAMNGGGFNFAAVCLGTYDPNHPIMKTPTPITNVCEYYRLTGTYLTPGSTTIASFSDGLILVAAKDDRSVVSINGYPGVNRQWTGQMDAVVDNAILWMTTAPYMDVPWVWEVPTTTVVPAQSSFNNGVYFTSRFTDATPMPLGTYTATFVIEENDPVAPEPNVPVIMHIVEAYVAPTAAFDSNTPVCLGQEVVFTNLTVPGVPPITDYLWDLGDGNTSTLENPTHLYAAAGTYTVTLTACNSIPQCSTAVDTVEVNPLPEASFTYAAVELTVTFTDTSLYATSWLWDFGDGITSTLQNPVHTYAAPGTYTVTLDAGNDCGTSEYVAVIPVSCAPPTADFSYVSFLLTVTFTNQSVGATSYLWDFGDGITSTLDNPVHTYALPSTYTVTLTAYSICGDSVMVAQVLVSLEPVAGFDSNTPVCLGEPMVFTNTSTSANAYLWDFGDGATSTETSPIHLYAAANLYDVSLQACNGPNCDEYTATVEVRALPQAGFTVVSDMLVFTFTNTSLNATSYLWDFGDGITDTVVNPVHTYGAVGTYTVTLAATGPCGTDVYTMVVEATMCHNVAIVVITPTINGCVVDFAAALTGDPPFAYLWDFGAFGTSTAPNPQVDFQATGTYSVTLDVTNCFAGHDTMTINVDVTCARTYFLYLPLQYKAGTP